VSTRTRAASSAIATEPETAVSGEAADGRRAWRDRNLNAVVDALLDLFKEGNLRPGADEIALRSGVSRRSVFRYFEDLDALDRMAIERQQGRVRHLIELPDIGEGTLDARIDGLVRQRIRLFEAVAPVARVSRLRAPFERVLAEELVQSRRFFRRQVERQFAHELAGLARADRTARLGAAEALSSFESFDLLAAPPGSSAKQAGEVMRRGLTLLFAGC
jgi:AcrR family transcriptional regulator